MMRDWDRKPLDSTEAPEQIAPLPRVSIQAFCETPDTAALVNEAVKDRRMTRAHVKVHTGGASAAVEAYREAPTPNLIVIESIGERGELVANLEVLSECCDPGTKVVVVGRVNDIVLYRDLIGRGVSDYLVTPFSVIDFVRALSNLYHNAKSEPIGRLIAVTGAKGGVGASTLAHNIAWSIARDLSLGTVIVDLDLPFGTAGLDFNQDPPQGIAEAVFAPERLDANLLDRLISKVSDNLSILAAPATLDRSYDHGETAFDPILDLLRTAIPCAVLDVPHQWTAWARRALVVADEVVVVSAPDLAGLRNTKNLLDMLRAARPHDVKPRLVLNTVGVLKRPEISVGDFAKSVELDPAAVIPFDPKLFGTAANNGQMLGEVEAANAITTSLAELARVLTGRADLRKGKRNPLLEPLMAILRTKRA